MVRRRVYIIMASIFVGGLASVLGEGSVLGTTYQDNVNLQFTFDSNVTISISGTNDGNLVIPSLPPGSAVDSNVITVTTSTNEDSGYVLYASVGNSTHADPSYNNTSLNHSTGNYTLTSLATTDNIADMSSVDVATNGKWGYATKLSSSSTWSNYKGLPLYSDGNGVTLVSNNDGSTTSLDFKIGAKASTTQAAGAYTNVVNFIAITNPTS